MQVKLHMVTIEDLVPGDHFLRKLEMVLDLSFVYEETKKAKGSGAEDRKETPAEKADQAS